MKYLCLGFAFACAFAGFAATPEGFTDDLDAALTRAGSRGTSVVAVFSGSDWCHWCKKLDEEVLSKPEFLKGATGLYELVYIDSPQNTAALSEKARERNPELVKKYAIEGFPSVLVLNARGEELVRTGYKSDGPAAYLKHLDEQLQRAPQVMKYLKPLQDAASGLKRKLGETMEACARAAQESERRQKIESKFREIGPSYVTQISNLAVRVEKTEVPAALTEARDDLANGLRQWQSYLQSALKRLEAK